MPVIKLLDKLKQDDMLRHSLYTVALILVGAAFSLLYDMSMSALLPPEQFGLLFSLVSLHTMILVFSDSLLLAVVIVLLRHELRQVYEALNMPLTVTPARSSGFRPHDR